METDLRFGDISRPHGRRHREPALPLLLRVEGEAGTVGLDNPCLPHKVHSLREWIGDGYREHALTGGATYD